MGQQKAFLFNFLKCGLLKCFTSVFNIPGPGYLLNQNSVLSGAPDMSSSFVTKEKKGVLFTRNANIFGLLNSLFSEILHVYKLSCTMNIPYFVNFR